MQLAGIACSSCLHKDCDGSKGFSRFEVDGERLDRCPLPIISNDSAMLCEQWPYFDKGYLPVAGGMLDQTAIFVQGMRVIQSEINKHQAEEAEKQRRRQGR